MNTETMAPEDIEVEHGGALEILSGNGALEAVDRASIDLQIATAQARPRSITKAIREAEELATLDSETAASCFYQLKRSGKVIEGPSARLAEIMAYSWGNLRVDADIVAEDRTHVTAMGTCFDLQQNVAVRVRVKRRITNRHGERYGDDMIGVTSNAAISIALRNAVFKVVPQAFVRRVYESAKSASLGTGTMEDKRDRALKWFNDHNVKPEKIYGFLGIAGRDDLGEAELITLRGLVTAITDGDTTIEQAFRPHDTSDGAGELNEALGEKAKAPEPDAEPPVEDEQAPDEELSIAQMEVRAEIGVKDREAIFERLGIKDASEDPDGYAAELQKIADAKAGA